MFVIYYRKIFLLISVVVTLVSLAIIGVFGLNLGIDFTGGSLTEVAYGEPLPEGVTGDQMAFGLAPETEVETALRALPLELGGFSVRQTETDDRRLGFIVRTRDLSESERVLIDDTLTSLKDGGEITRFTTIGPVIGEELKDKAIWAIAIVALIIVLYVAFAFWGVSYPVSSTVYGGITVLSLMHDVIAPTAAVALLGHFTGIEIDILFVMALLAVLGYSVNDTLVIFDRIRENLIRYRQEKKVRTKRDGLDIEEIEYILTKPFSAIVGEALNQSLLRSVNTSLTTALTLGALYVIGGSATTIFAFVLLVGVVAGTYSSIFFASPLLVWWSERNNSTKAN